MGLMKRTWAAPRMSWPGRDAGAQLDLTAASRLRVLIPAVENAISSDAYRPGDILTSRKGLTVEVNNTDAEGRLVLADALALADEGAQDADLDGDADRRGAGGAGAGPAALLLRRRRVAAALQAAGLAHADPVWRMPFWEPYESMIEPGIADLDNAPGGGFASAITAALFLRRFTGQARHYAHFDIYGWQPSPPQPAQRGPGSGDARDPARAARFWHDRAPPTAA